MLYAASAMLALSSLVIAAFVIIAHIVLTTILVLRRRRRHEPARPLVRPLEAAFGITAAVSLAIYGPTAIEVLSVVGKAYIHEGTGFRPTSLDFAKETLRGLAVGFGPLALVGAVAFAALAAVGTVSLFRRAWLIVGTFVFALGMMAAVVLLEGWLTSPRFFLLVVPLAFLVVVHMLGLVAARASGLIPDPSTRRRLHATMAGVAVAVCAVALALGLPRYYAVPKQPFREAIATFSREAQPGDALIAVYQADLGFDYYVHRLGLEGQHRFYSARTVAKLDSLGPVLAGRRVLLASTFDRTFKLEDPVLWNRVQSGWTPVQRLPATVGYGEITFWVPKADAANWAAHAAMRSEPGLLLQPDRSDGRRVEESVGAVEAESSRGSPPQGR